MTGYPEEYCRNPEGSFCEWSAPCPKHRKPEHKTIEPSENTGVTNPGATTQLQELIAEAYSNSKDHGFHDGEEAMDQEYVQGLKIALMHSELSEALECVRNGEIETMYEHQFIESGEKYINLHSHDEGKPGKPLGLLSEYADVLIRIFDEIGRLNRGLDFERVLMAKLRYNRSRPYKHGRKC